jgi:hypothetical protein
MRFMLSGAPGGRLLITGTARGLWVLIGLLLLAHSARAQPQLNYISQRGLRSGGKTAVVIDGERLSHDTRLVLGVPVEAQVLKSGATDKRIEVELTLDENVPSGIYLLRALNAEGVSNGLAVAVDSLNQAADSQHIDSLPAALSGSIAGDQSAKVTFAGKKDESVLIEIESRRLLSQLNPVVHLYDARGVQMAWAQGTRKLEGDARLSAVLPADGQYIVEVHDALYQARAPGHFRLKIGNFHYADLAIPSAVKQGTKASIQFAATNLPADAKVDAEAPPLARFFPAPHYPAINLSGLRPALWASDWDEVLETPAPSADVQTIAAPAGVHGRLAEPGQEDRYRITATAGQKLRLEVHALRAGSPLDGVLTVYDDTGKNALASNDDRPGMADPGLEFGVPVGAAGIVVGLKDLLGRGGQDFVYRLTVVPQDHPDFSLTLSDDRVNVPRGGRALVRVGVERRGYNGPIELSFEGLPAGVTVENALIPSGSSTGVVLLHGIGLSGDFSLSRVVGRAASENGSSGQRLRVAMLPANSLSERQRWLREEVAVALARRAPLHLAWDPQAVSLPLGAKLSATVKATRADGFSGPVRLSLITTQPTPKKTVKENNQDKQVDDVERTLRLDGTPMLSADQGQTTANIIVPADLADTTYTLVLRGDLLGADGKQVLATTYTPVIAAKPARRVTIALSGNAEIEARAGLGETGKLVGKVIRQEGFADPLRVTLEGLPAGVPAPFADLTGDKSEFELAVRLPHGLKAEALKNVKLVGVSLASPGDLESAVRTNPLPVTLKVVSGEKPPVEPPLRIFEDEEEFATSLNQGGGQIRLEGGEKYSGASSVRVTGDQRFNPALSSLGVKIRKDPGPGEYRYLRFAWKKQGGNQICLQLNHDGAWGPTAGGSGAKFRYHAGPGDCYGGSLRVAARLPNRMTVVTRDLYADFGEFTLTGLALSPIDGQFGLFDHIYLGRSVDDLDSVKPEGR